MEAREVRDEPSFTPQAKVSKITLLESLKEDVEENLWNENWFYLKDGRPARLDWSQRQTYDPRTEGVTTFDYRTTIVTQCDEVKILWETADMFEFAEEWRTREDVKFDRIQDMVLTIMERQPREPSWYGTYEMEQVSQREKEASSSSTDVAMEPQEKDKQVEMEKMLPKIGDDEFEENMIIDGVEPTPDSSLKELKQACKFLGVGVTGSKALLWQRLKREAAETKLKTTVEISKSIEREYEREPKGPKPVYEPTPEERAKHNLTHRELGPDEGGAPSPKRGVETLGSVEESEGTRQRMDEGTTEVKERPEKQHKASQVKQRNEEVWLNQKEEYVARIRKGRRTPKCKGS